MFIYTHAEASDEPPPEQAALPLPPPEQAYRYRAYAIGIHSS